MHHFRIGKKNSTQFCKRNSSIKLRKAPIVRNVIYNNVSVNFRVLFQATMGRNKKRPCYYWISCMGECWWGEQMKEQQVGLKFFKLLWDHVNLLNQLYWYFWSYWKKNCTKYIPVFWILLFILFNFFFWKCY